MGASESILRLFVAIYPPTETVHALLASLDSLGINADRGRVAHPLVHLTIQFIGDTPKRSLGDVQESVERAAAGIPPFDLQPLRLITLPEGPRPRLVATETNLPPPLLELHRRLAHRLARNLRDRSRERFRPHLTLHRFKVQTVSVEHPVQVAPFRVEHIGLMRSILRPAGAEHAEVLKVPLG